MGLQYVSSNSLQSVGLSGRSAIRQARSKLGTTFSDKGYISVVLIGSGNDSQLRNSTHLARRPGGGSQFMYKIHVRSLLGAFLLSFCASVSAPANAHEIRAKELIVEVECDNFQAVGSKVFIRPHAEANFNDMRFQVRGTSLQLRVTRGEHEGESYKLAELGELSKFCVRGDWNFQQRIVDLDIPEPMTISVDASSCNSTEVGPSQFKWTYMQNTTVSISVAPGTVLSSASYSGSTTTVLSSCIRSRDAYLSSTLPTAP